MSWVNRGDDGEDWGHADAGLKLRIKWVHQLREALCPFADGAAITPRDLERAREAMKETDREWLYSWAGVK